MADWKEILSDNDEQLTEAQLLQYLANDVAEAEKDLIERKISNSAFETDALQGLLQVKDKAQLQQDLKHLHQKLQQLTAKRQRKEKRTIKIFEWIVLAIILLLFVCVIGYIIINLQNKTPLHTQNLNQSFYSLFRCLRQSSTAI